MKIAVGLILAFAIGAACRATGIPLPAPPVLIGALVVASMSVGYVVTDKLAARREARYRALCGGPTGVTARERGDA